MKTRPRRTTYLLQAVFHTLLYWRNTDQIQSLLSVKLIKLLITMCNVCMASGTL